MNKKTIKSKNSLANLSLRLVFLVFSILTALILLFNYQISAKAVNQEVLRNMQQTSSLLQHLFDTHLSNGKNLQNNLANSVTLQQHLEKQEEALLDNYFLNLEKSDEKMVFDFGFITKGRHTVWNDGNAPFFGIQETQLEWIARSIVFNNRWHFINLDLGEGSVYMLARRVPVVAEETGEVLGQLYGAIVLNNNIELLHQFEIASGVNTAMLLIGGKPIASTIENPEQILSNNFPEESHEPFGAEYLYNQIDLRIAGVKTPVSVYTTEDNTNILSLEHNYRISLLFYFISILLAGFLARYLIQKRVVGELAPLMKFAQGCQTDKNAGTYSGSEIKEFNHIGRTLEKTFKDLRDKERSFQDLFDFSLSPIIVWDSHGEVVRMNSASDRVFEKNGEFSSRAFLNFQSVIKPQLDMVNEGAVITGMNITVFDTVYRWNLSPIELEDGVHSIIAQGQDITTLIEAERQSNLARIEAEKSANARADFLAKMSHEIRTPLNGILGISQLLKNLETDSDKIEKIEVLCQSGEHLLTVLNDILDFSRMEQGKFNIVLSDFNFSSLVSSVANIYRPLCMEKHLKFEIVNEVPENTHFHSDKVRLNQIIYNLLSNAVKFTHRGSISLRFELPDLEAYSGDQPIRHLSINVQDSGIGISSAKLDTIFEPFEQSEKTTTREYGGSGLGLTIVKHLVALLGGKVSVKSLVGSGSQFMVSIPVQVVSPHNIQSGIIRKEDLSELFEQQVSLLLVEDNKTNAFIAKAFCEKYNMQVDWAEDGLSALEKIKTSQYDVIFMDNQMPNLDGIEATKIIREQLKVNTPIFACTADGYEETRDKFLEAGADYVIVKPLREKNLFEAFSYLKTRLEPDQT
ncbi:ATPase [Vibrio albus]|uniref:Autoinducer 2 sensor kinase/phosphatase LuxQ n=1 Tax=Vibrio albus TaxID=2200953 RepID=A0A2U3B677_9VIBR|nr:LuxQ periplasmic sensor domain-containing protein [Vibrio albus]PWI32287.1 ATPase [Vibrio albus]